MPISGEPGSVDPEWQAYFASLGEQRLTPPNWAAVPPGGAIRKSPSQRRSYQRAGRRTACQSRLRQRRFAPTTENVRAVAQDSIRAVQMVSAYRTIGISRPISIP